MLVLSRNIDQQIICGEGDNKIVFTIVDIRKDKVRIGIEAPETIPIHRREVYERIHGSQDGGT